MNINQLNKLQQSLISGMSIADLDDRALLNFGQTLLTQYRQSKTVLRKMTADSSSELLHWQAVKELTFLELDKVIAEINIRTLTNEWEAGLTVKYSALIGKILYAVFDEENKDKDTQDDEDNFDEIELILE